MPTDTVWHVKVGTDNIDSAYVIAQNAAIAVRDALDQCPYGLGDVEAETFSATSTCEETDDLTESFLFTHHFCGWTECAACSSRISQDWRDDAVTAGPWVYCDQDCADKGPQQKSRKPETVVWLSTEY